MKDQIGKGFILFCGLFTLYCTRNKPNWYWNHHKAVFLRELIGDRGTEIFYYCLGLILVGMWVMVTFV